MTGLVLFVVVMGAAAVAVLAVLIFHWLAARREAADRSIPIFFPMTPDDSLGMADPQWGRRASASSSAPPSSSSVAPPVVPYSPKATPSVAPSAAAFTPSHAAPGAPPSIDDVQEDDPAPNETVRFVRPVDEAVQLLPGRLEVLAGETQHHEIRFVRLPGEPNQLILGRDAGPSRQYVGLSSSTVSRRHAVFHYADGCWAVRNLSKTNPLVVNNDELSPACERRLVDGDRLELGEVVLRFHTH